MENERVGVFEEGTARDLIRLLPRVGGQSPLPNGNRFPNFIMLGRTGTGGLSTTSESNVFLYLPTATGWSLSTETHPAIAWPTLISGEKDILLFPVNGRWVGLEVCS